VTPPLRLRALKTHTGTWARLASAFGVTPAALFRWLSDDRQIRGPALRLLEIYETHPELMLTD
jgi:DNA-binding transcriptional regulator YiaG